MRGAVSARILPDCAEPRRRHPRRRLGSSSAERDLSVYIRGVRLETALDPYETDLGRARASEILPKSAPLVDCVQVSGDGATAGTGSAAGAAGGAAIVMASSAVEAVS